MCVLKKSGSIKTNCILTVLIVCSLLVPKSIIAQSGPVQISTENLSQTLQELGLTLELEKPEGAILAFSLPDVYVLPDSPLYLLVQVWESLNLLWADTPSERSRLLFLFSERRLAETLSLLQENETEYATQNIERYKSQLSQAISNIPEIEDGSARQEGYNQLERQMWFQKAFNSVVKAEGITDVLQNVSVILENRADDQGGIELSPVPDLP